MGFEPTICILTGWRCSRLLRDRGLAFARSEEVIAMRRMLLPLCHLWCPAVLGCGARPDVARGEAGQHEEGGLPVRRSSLPAPARDETERRAAQERFLSWASPTFAGKN